MTKYFQPKPLSVQFDSISLRALDDTLTSYGYQVDLMTDTLELNRLFRPVSIHNTKMTMNSLLDSVFAQEPAITYFVYNTGHGIFIEIKRK